MKGLLWKELCVSLRAVKRILIVAPILLFIVMAVTALGPGAEPAMYMIPVVFCTIIGMCMMLVTFGHDDASGWLKLGFMMPVTRLDCYHVKLLLNLICTGCTAVEGMMIALISALIFGDMCPMTAGFIFAAGGGMLLVSTFIGTCLNSLIIRLGMQKASLIFMTTFIFLQFCGISGLLGSLLSNVNLTAVSIAIGAAVVLITVVLYCLGRKWILGKEL